MYNYNTTQISYKYITGTEHFELPSTLSIVNIMQLNIVSLTLYNVYNINCYSREHYATEYS
jgi:hypothetical protein